MTMKKRFLGLALAAMVAVPATSAYAADKTITGNVNDLHTHDVTVSGTVRNVEGQAPEGTIEVELPTSMQFTVDQDGVFTGSEFTVKNKSTVGIDVSVASFSETKPSGGITLIPMSTEESALASKPRNEVALSLVGDKNSVDLAEFAKQGVVGDNTKLLTVSADNGVGTIQLTGKAGKFKSELSSKSEVDQNGVQEDFRLVFQIKKESK